MQAKWIMILAIIASGLILFRYGPSLWSPQPESMPDIFPQSLKEPETVHVDSHRKSTEEQECHICILENHFSEFEKHLPLDRWKHFFSETSTRAATGDAEAQYRMGMIHLSGVTVSPDRAEAMKWFRLSAEKKHAKGSFWWANELYNQHAIETGQVYGTVEARRLMKVAADGGVTQAHSLLGAYYESIGSFTEAAKIHEAALVLNATCSRFSLAQLLLDGKGVPKDPSRAVELLLADTDCANATDVLVDLYTGGKVVEKNFQIAVDILLRAGYPVHLSRAAAFYETGGPHLAPNKEKAIELYRQASESGLDVRSQLRRLGVEK